MQCGARDDLWHLDTPTGPAAVHPECFEFLPRPEAAEPTAAYRAASPDCVVTIVQIPAEGLCFRKAFGVLQLRPPALVPEARWRLAVEDGKRFLRQWGDQAQRLGWDSRDLFGLIEVPECPSPSFNRLARYDRLGLVWALQGGEVIALTTEAAIIRNATGATLTYYRKGPIGAGTGGWYPI